MLDFQRGESLGENISDHVSSRAIDRLNLIIQWMKWKQTDVDGLGVSMIPVVLGEGDCRLIVRNNMVAELERESEHLTNQSSKPEYFFHCM